MSWVFIVWWSALKSFALMFRVRSGSGLYRLVVWFLGSWCWSWLVLTSLLGVTVCCWVLVWVLLFSSVIDWYIWVLGGLVVKGRLGYGSGLSAKGMGVGSFCVMWLIWLCLLFFRVGLVVGVVRFVDLVWWGYVVKFIE